MQEVEQEKVQEVEQEQTQKVEQEQMQEVEEEKVQEVEREEEEEEAEEPADSGVFLNGHIPDPVTPNIALNGSMDVDTPLDDSAGDKDELPMLVDSPVAETRRPRGRPPASSKGKEKENTRELRTSKVVSPAMTPEPVAPRRTRSGQVRVPEPSPSVKPKAGTGRGRGRPPKKKVEPVEEVVEETRQLRSETKRAASARGVGTRKRRRIESSAEAEAGVAVEEQRRWSRR
ncbi:hypothetical protein BJ912DRAFT_658802 [Pholiota molesta]|nr:hypothetical protein BJ912DRAFT_658802 [Pholiota molesta]